MILKLISNRIKAYQNPQLNNNSCYASNARKLKLIAPVLEQLLLQ